jgi:hypothetical protein
MTKSGETRSYVASRLGKAISINELELGSCLVYVRQSRYHSRMVRRLGSSDGFVGGHCPARHSGEWIFASRIYLGGRKDYWTAIYSKAGTRYTQAKGRLNYSLPDSMMATVVIVGSSFVAVAFAICDPSTLVPPQASSARLVDFDSYSS